MSARIGRLAAFGFLALFLCVFASSAQDSVETDQAAWDATAARAEEAISNAKASDDALEALRNEIAGQRAEALAIVERGSIEVETLKAKLNALGPAPDKDHSEPAGIARQRTEISNRLAVANEPILMARQSFNRAEVLIRAIDRIIRARQRASLFERAPSPLVPTRWFPALADFSTYFSQMAGGIKERWNRPGEGQLLRENAIVSAILALLGIAIALVVAPFAHRTLERRINQKTGMFSGRSSYAVLVISRLVLPGISAVFLVIAAMTAGLEVNETRNISDIIIALAFVPILANWIAHLNFAPGIPSRRIVNIQDNKARQATRISLWLALVLAVDGFAEIAAEDYKFTPEALSLSAFLIVIAGAFYLSRFALVLQEDKASSKSDPGGFNILFVRILQLAALASVVCAGMGYVELARQALMPVILSLGILGLGLAMHSALMRLINPLHDAAGLKDSPASALLPYLAGLGVVILLAPVASLMWGARVADLSEFWTLLTQGIEINGRRVSAGTVVTLATVFLVGLFVTRVLQRFLKVSLLPKTRMDTGAQSAAVTGTGYAGIMLSVLAAISVAGLDLSNLAIMAGALSVGLGFGLQAVVSNFVSGIILLIERPVKEGDWIEVGGHSGIVRKIAVRATRIETFDKHSVIVPNAELITGVVKNMTLGSTEGRLVLPVSIRRVEDVEDREADHAGRRNRHTKCVA